MNITVTIWVLTLLWGQVPVTTDIDEYTTQTKVSSGATSLVFYTREACENHLKEWMKEQRALIHKSGLHEESASGGCNEFTLQNPPATNIKP